MTFEQCVQSIHEGSVINFCEYSLDRRERKRLSLQIENGVVHRVFHANEKVSRDVLEQYYGTELDDIDYQQLSMMNCPRLAIQLGLNPDNSLDIKIITLNKDFYDTGLQTLSVINETIVNSFEPNYVMAQKGW